MQSATASRLKVAVVWRVQRVNEVDFVIHRSHRWTEIQLAVDLAVDLSEIWRLPLWRTNAYDVPQFGIVYWCDVHGCKCVRFGTEHGQHSRFVGTASSRQCLLGVCLTSIVCGSVCPNAVNRRYLVLAHDLLHSTWIPGWWSLLAPIRSSVICLMTPDASSSAITARLPSVSKSSHA